MANLPPYPLPMVKNRQNLLADYAVIAIANKHSAATLSDPHKKAIYTEQFIAAIEEALTQAESLLHFEKVKDLKKICICGTKGPHLCRLTKEQE